MLLQNILQSIGDAIAENGKRADQSDQFPSQNYALLEQHGVFSALIPEALGGAGCDYREMADFLASLATYHPSTALSLSMHQHIIAANRYNHSKGGPGRALLENVAINNLKLISTGAGDWLASNGRLEKTSDGYLFNATKHFCSGCPAGDVLVTSGPYEDPDEGWQVLHFAIPMRTEGVTILDNWQALGMSGTGSNSVKLENVVIPAERITVRRPRGDFHTMWSVILPVALPLIMSVYLGTARTAARKAKTITAESKDPVTPYLLGEMENALTAAELAVADMIRIVDEFNFTADLSTVNEILKRKTIAASACKETAAKALETCGGYGFMRCAAIESLFRDTLASHFHPLQEKRQLLFTGTLAMGLQPPSQAY